MQQPKKELMDVFRLHGIVAKKPTGSAMDEELVTNSNKLPKKVAPAKQKK